MEISDLNAKIVQLETDKDASKEKWEELRKEWVDQIESNRKRHLEEIDQLKEDHIKQMQTIDKMKESSVGIAVEEVDRKYRYFLGIYEGIIQTEKQIQILRLLPKELVELVVKISFTLVAKGTELEYSRAKCGIIIWYIVLGRLMCHNPLTLLLGRLITSFPLSE